MENKKILDLIEAGKRVVYVFVCIVIIVTIVLLVNDFIFKEIEWKNFVEFIISCLVIVFIIDKGINYFKIPGIIEIGKKLEQIEGKMETMSLIQKQILKNSINIILPPAYSEEKTEETLAKIVQKELTKYFDNI